MTFPTNFNSFFLKALDKGVQCCFSLVGVELYFEVKTPQISYQTSSFSTRILKLVNFTVFFCIINKEKPEFSFFPISSDRFDFSNFKIIFFEHISLKGFSRQIIRILVFFSLANDSRYLQSRPLKIYFLGNE